MWFLSVNNMCSRFSLRTYLNTIQTIATFNQRRINCFMDFTGCSKDEAMEYLECNSFMVTLPVEELEYRIKRLKMLSLADNTTLASSALLKHHPVTLKHRYYSLRESGVSAERLSSQILSRFLTLIKKKVSLLKRKGIINVDTDVFALLSSIGSFNRESLSAFNEDISLLELRIEVIRRFLIENYKFSPDDPRIDGILISRLKYKSLTEVKKSLNILQTRLGFTLDKIIRNPFVIYASEAENSVEMIEKCPVVAGLDISKVMQTHPKILSTRANNFVHLVEILKKYEISDESVSRCLEVFTLNVETVEKRLEEIKRNNLLHVRRHHPRILELVIYHNKAKSRLKELERMKIPYASLNRLASSDNHFQKFCDFGSERHHGRDIVYFLRSELGRTKNELLKKLDRHPYWTFTSLLVINSNLSLLRKCGFSNDEIFDEVFILLYPMKRIEDEMEKLNGKQEVTCCFKENGGGVRRDCILPLTLYYIEKDSNFSGGAIWDKESTYPQPPHFLDRITSQQEVAT